jgi:hypothetical protein
MEEEEEEDDVSKCAEPILIRLNCLSVLSIRNRVRSIFENKTRSTHKTVDNCWWNVCHRNPLNRLPEIIRKERDSS